MKQAGQASAACDGLTPPYTQPPCRGVLAKARSRVVRAAQSQPTKKGKIDVTHLDSGERIENYLVLAVAGKTVYTTAVSDPLAMPLHPHSVPAATASGDRLAETFRRWGLSGREPQISYLCGINAAARSTLELMLTRLNIEPRRMPLRQLIELVGKAKAEPALQLIERQIASAEPIVKVHARMTVTVVVGDEAVVQGIARILTEGRYDAPRGAHTVPREGEPVFLRVISGPEHPRTA